MLKNFMNRSEQKTYACLSSNRKTCQIGAHCIRKKKSYLTLILQLVKRLGFVALLARHGFDSQNGKSIKKMKLIFFRFNSYAQLSSLSVL